MEDSSVMSGNPNLLYENFNMDDILVRSVIAGLLDLLNNKIDYTQAWGDNILETVKVPWMYNLGTSDERFMQDNYTFFGQGCFGGNKISGTFNSIPRGYLTYNGSNIESSSICNRFVQVPYLKMKNGRLTTYTSFMYSMPLTMNFDCKVDCDNIITALKIEQAIRAAFYKNKTFYVQFHGMRIGCTAGFPEQINNDVFKTTDYSFDNQQKRPVISFSLAVETYQPVMDKSQEMEYSKNIKGFGIEIRNKSDNPDVFKIKFKEMDSMIYPCGTSIMLEWVSTSMNTEFYNVALSYKDKEGNETIINPCIDNQQFYVWDIPESFNDFKYPEITVCDEERVCEKPVIKIIPNKDTKRIDEKSFVVIKRGYIVPDDEFFKVPITIDYKSSDGKLMSISGKYSLNLVNGRVDIDNPVTIEGEPELFKGKVNYKPITLKISYTHDSSIFDEIPNLLIL